MSSIIKRTFLTFMLAVSLGSCIIKDARPEDCQEKTIEVVGIEEGASMDIVLTDAYGDSYYINRGLERGLELSGLKAALVDKKVNLHLYKFWFGTSGHISQLTLDNQVIFSEFN